MKGMEVVVQEHDGVFMTTSRDVAEALGKRHADVLRAIRNLDCSAEFAQRNFAVSTYESVSGKGRVVDNKMYYMTRDGFTFLAMGFTGKKAARFTEKYINAFNEMEEALRNQVPRGLSRLELAQMVVAAEEEKLALAEE